MEEMAINVGSHGFVKDSKRRTVVLRAVYKDDRIILRIRDDCIPFSPKERSQLSGENDPAKNVGIRMIYKIADEIEYRNLPGLKVLTVRSSSVSKKRICSEMKSDR